MKTLLITNQVDAQIGWRLAGVHTAFVESSDEVHKALKAAIKDKDIGMVLITESLAALCYKTVMDYKTSSETTLILTIPNPGQDFKDHIGEYVRKTIGIQYE